MDTIWPQIVAVMAANLLTVVFLYGLWHARTIYRDEDARPGVLACLIIPPLVMAVGFFLYG